MMSKVDTTLAIIILVSSYNGFKDGFLVELFSSLAIMVGILCGFALMRWTMVSLERNFNIDASALPYIGFATVFFIIVFVVNLLIRYLNRKVNHSYLGKLDQGAGGLLALLRSAFMLSVLFWIFHSMQFSLPDHWTENSWIMPLITNLAPSITHGIGTVIPFFKGVF